MSGLGARRSIPDGQSKKPRVQLELALPMGTLRTTLGWAPQFLYSSSRLPPMQLNVTMCARVRVYVCVCTAYLGLGMQGTRGPEYEARPERAKGCGSLSSHSLNMPPLLGH